MHQDRKLWPETADLEGVTTRWPLRIQPFSFPPCSFSTEKKARKQKQNNNKTFFINEKQPLGKTQPQRLEITLSSSSATSPTRFFVPHSLLRSQKGELFTGQFYATDTEFDFLVLQRTFSLPGLHLTHLSNRTTLERLCWVQVLLWRAGRGFRSALPTSS